MRNFEHVTHGSSMWENSYPNFSSDYNWFRYTSGITRNNDGSCIAIVRLSSKDRAHRASDRFTHDAAARPAALISAWLRR